MIEAESGVHITGCHIEKIEAIEIIPGVMEESYTASDGSTKQMVFRCSDKGKAILEQVVNAFDEEVLSSLDGELVGLTNNVVTIGASLDLRLPDKNYMGSDIKLYLNTKELALKDISVYTDQLIKIGLPTTSNPILFGKYRCMGTYNLPSELANLNEIYLSCDHDLFCSHYNVTLPKGNYRTYYSVSYDTVSLKINKIKSYQYNSKNFRADWEEMKETFMAKQHFFGDQQ